MSAEPIGPLAAPPRAGVYAWYVLVVLTIVNACHAIDRAMVSILVESIRIEFGFSDVQLGVLSGLGFALFYTALGFPIARWADTGNRRNILALGIAVWSAMTALSGRAVNFITFLAARIGVGVGEATCYPTAYPLISDYFPQAMRPIAMAVFQTGLFIGIIAGNILAAEIAAAHGWRASFYAMGLPGLAIALLVLLTVREPQRGRSDATSAPAIAKSFSVGFSQLLSNSKFLLLTAASTCLTIGSATLGSWGPAFMMRLHGVDQAQVGYVAAPMGVGGMLGTLVGGLIGTLLAKRSASPRAPLFVPAITALVAVPAAFAFLLVDATPLAVAAGAISAFMVASHTGPAIAVSVSLVRAEIRGIASSFIVVGHLLIGFGIAPVIVGQLSDMLRAAHGAEALRYAMLAAPVMILIGWVTMLMAIRAIRPETQER